MFPFPGHSRPGVETNSKVQGPKSRDACGKAEFICFSPKCAHGRPAPRGQKRVRAGKGPRPERDGLRGPARAIFVGDGPLPSSRSHWPQRREGRSARARQVLRGKARQYPSPARFGVRPARVSPLGHQDGWQCPIAERFRDRRPGRPGQNEIDRLRMTDQTVGSRMVAEIDQAATAESGGKKMAESGVPSATDAPYRPHKRQFHFPPAHRKKPFDRGRSTGFCQGAGGLRPHRRPSSFVAARSSRFLVGIARRHPPLRSGRRAAENSRRCRLKHRKPTPSPRRHRMRGKRIETAFRAVPRPSDGVCGNADD